LSANGFLQAIMDGRTVDRDDVRHGEKGSETGAELGQELAAHALFGL
jgi:hypothetical protein